MALSIFSPEKWRRYSFKLYSSYSLHSLAVSHKMTCKKKTKFMYTYTDMSVYIVRPGHQTNIIVTLSRGHMILLNGTV